MGRVVTCAQHRRRTVILTTAWQSPQKTMGMIVVLLHDRKSGSDVARNARVPEG
jgi:hypothetical protein